MMKKMLTLAGLSLLPALSVGAPELKGNPEELRRFLEPRPTTVEISAYAEETGYTDIANVLLVITTEEKLLSDAIGANADLRKSIQTRLVDAGIDPENINSSEFSTSPQYGWFGKKPTSYKVINRMAIEIDSGELLKEIAGVVDSSEDISLASTSFEHSEKQAFEDKVREKALTEVMADKAFYEERLNVKLTPLLFKDGSIRAQPARDAMALEEIVVSARTSSGMVADMPMAAPDTALSSFDEVQYRTTVTVVFRVDPSE